MRVYVKTDMVDKEDRFPAFSGLAVRYIDLYQENEVVKEEEYLAGLWRQKFAQGLAWSIEGTKLPSYNLWCCAPSWSWASVPLRSDISTQPAFEPAPEFDLLEEPNLEKQGQSDGALEVVKRGALVKSVKVRGLFRRFIQERSVRKACEVIQAKNGQEDAFDFPSCINEWVHSRNSRTGRIVASEPHKEEIVGQLDYIFPDDGNDPQYTVSENDLKNIYCLQIGQSSMLLLMADSLHSYRRVGICNTVRKLFFFSSEAGDAHA